MTTRTLRPLWHNIWIRALAIHPIVAVAPWVVLSDLLAQRTGSDIDDISWALWVVVLGAVASFAATFFLALVRPLGGGVRLLVVGAGLLASGIALYVGLAEWSAAADIACHGGYECPF